MKKYLLPTFLLLFCSILSLNLFAQDNKLNILISATEYIPADIIVFNINVNAEAKNARDAFKIHKEREAFLAGMLKEMKISEENIRFQPVRINKSYRNNYSDERSQTNQQVSVSFSDFDLYEELQLRLIENEFDSFNANFNSTKMEEGKVSALSSAIRSAKEKAEFIAQETGKKISDIYSISYSEHTFSSPRAMSMDMEMSRAQSPSMMDFEQSIAVTASITIEFTIEN